MARFLQVLLLVGHLLRDYMSQFVYTQLSDNFFFGPSTKQILLTPNLGDFVSTQKYSLWGWHRFQGETPAISNVLSLRNVQLVSQGGTGGNLPLQEYPPCPASIDDLSRDPNLLSSPLITQNPNCFSLLSGQNGSTGAAGVRFLPTTDILYINFDLTSLVDYSFIFLIQTGISSVGSSDMRVLGFTNIPLYKDVWSYFAISCDYQTGVASAYYRAFDGFTPAYQDRVEINYPAFQLTPLVQLVIAGVETNPYFESTSGFIGNIAYVEMALFYAPLLELMWMGYLPLSGYANNGILTDIYFDQYQTGGVLTSRGGAGGQFIVVGPHAPVFASDSNLSGVQFGSSASVPLTGLDFENSADLVRSLSFLLYFNYTEPLPEQYFLIQRGSPGSDGFFGVSLVRTNEGRALRVDAFGATGPVSWTSSQVLRPNTRYEAIVGMALSPNNTAQLLYWDRSGRVELVRLSDFFPFSTAPQPTVLLGGNQIDPTFTGSLTFYRFTALNSLSNVIYYFILSDSTDSVLLDSNQYCLVRTSWYGNDFGCLICRNSILGYDTRKCLLYCPVGFKNAFNDACLPCLTPDCSEVGSTVWYIYKLNDYEYELRPSRPLLSDVDYNNLFTISIPGLPPGSYNYTLIPNPGDQSVRVRFGFRDGFQNQQINVALNQDMNRPLYDANRNIPFVSNYTVAANYTRQCVLEDNRYRSAQGLAIATLVFIAAAFVLLLLLSLCFWRRLFDPLGMWKFLLHHWMRFQMVAMFLFLAIYMPCCVRAFLEQLYWIGVSWNKALGRRINEVNRDDPVYQQAIINTPSPRQFAAYDVYPYMLHNVGVFFIIQCAIFIFYIMMKLWDCCSRNSGRCCYTLFVWFEYTINIVFYALIAFQVFVFAGLNLRHSTWERSYFTISFVIAILYLAVFALFWLYSACRILGPATYFYNPLNYNKFMYFFAGYRNSFWARSYDLWLWLAYFIIGFMIGILTHEGLAQTIIILAVLVILFFITLLIRPYRSIVLYIFDLISQILIIAAAALFLVIAVYNNNGCYLCGDLDFEGSLCWAIVMLLFLGLLFLWLGLVAHILLSLCLGDKYRSWGRPVREVVQTNYVNTVQDVGVLTTTDQMGVQSYAQPALFADTYVQETIVPPIQPIIQPIVPMTSIRSTEFAAGQDPSVFARNKSMAQFMNEVRAEDTSHNQNMTYLSVDSYDNLLNRAGTLAADDADEEIKQTSVLQALAFPQINSLSTPGNPSYLQNRKKEFYAAAATFGDPSVDSASASALQEDITSNLAYPVNRNEYAKYSTSTTNYSPGYFEVTNRNLGPPPLVPNTFNGFQNLVPSAQTTTTHQYFSGNIPHTNPSPTVANAMIENNGSTFAGLANDTYTYLSGIDGSRR